jgi:hypothetical protein
VRNRQIFGIGQLGRRLVLAFVAVALAAIAVNATISSATLDSDINRLAIQQEGSLTQAIALTARAAYEGHGWARMDLDPVRHMARRGEASVEVYDMSGKPVGGSAHFATFRTAGRSGHRTVQLPKPRRRLAKLPGNTVARTSDGCGDRLTARVHRLADRGPGDQRAA